MTLSAGCPVFTVEAVRFWLPAGLVGVGEALCVIEARPSFAPIDIDVRTLVEESSYDLPKSIGLGFGPHWSP